MSHARWTVALVLMATALGASSCAKQKKPRHAKGDAPAAKAANVAAKPVELDVCDAAVDQKITLPVAIAAAVVGHQGEVADAAVEGTVTGGKRDVYVDVMLIDAAGAATQVKVNPIDGKVIGAQQEEDAVEAAKLGAVLKRLAPGHLSLADLVGRASAGGTGKAVDATFAMKGDAVVAQVRILDGKDLKQVTLDTKSGATLAARTLAPGEDDEDDEKDGDEGAEK